ncbi:ABC transporter permease [Pseudomonas brassicacearum]|uniref:ABC transporter permease n=1 Tax=Pseudomonas brassicacearum subsp. neoaurantiaca TaxID=494916 RepID=A0A7V8RHZ6_9PSED|nr:ABC transporter permease [Pseudomonas brassicacearum]MBA1376844.1 ABC transporter permease [Pseudomonas brassicacearum subsp. neoaurantiaca]
MHIRTLILSQLFVKEQLKEPIAFFWIMVSPCALFYLLAATRQDLNYFTGDYTLTTSWFYAYISSSVALFGFSFYIVGRRESGFIRSFIYSAQAKSLFLRSHLLAYSLISILYCTVFYLITRPAFGDYEFYELIIIVTRFYLSFMLFCVIGLLLTLLPIDFQNSNTTFSILSFCMLVLGMMGANDTDKITSIMNIGNPLALAYRIMTEGGLRNPYSSLLIILAFGLSYKLTKNHLRINPVWSRY